MTALRPRHQRLVWAIFAVAALLVIDALAWATFEALGVEAREAAATAEAAHQQSLRLALWRMDATIAPIIAREAARAATADPADAVTDPLVRTRYSIDSLGRISGQADADAVADALSTLAAQPEAAAESLRAARDLRQLSDLLATGRVLPAGKQAPPDIAAPAAERLAEAEADANPAADVIDNQKRLMVFNRSTTAASVPPRVEIGPLEPRWITLEPRPELVFTRRVTLDGAAFDQGVWIDWPALRGELLAGIVDLFPDAELIPTVALGDGAAPLASIPATLRITRAALPTRTMTPLRLTLAVAWLATLTALTGVGLALASSARVAARRAAFVSAVAHELRTPLTGFRLHADLLASGALAADEPARHAAALAISADAARLSRIVDDVLDAARRGDAHDHRAQTKPSPGLDLDAARALLAGLASDAAADLTWPEPAPTGRLALTAPDLERIARNLLENARIHAAPPVTVAAAVTATHVIITIRDHGPGLDAAARRRLFQPFERGPDAAARPGLGLGLWIARDLARRAGGDLRPADPQPARGAALAISLPFTRDPKG